MTVLASHRKNTRTLGLGDYPPFSPFERLCDLNLFEPPIPRDLHKVTEQASRRRAAYWTCAQQKPAWSELGPVNQLPLQRSANVGWKREGGVQPGSLTWGLLLYAVLVERA